MSTHLGTHTTIQAIHASLALNASTRQITKFATANEPEVIITPAQELLSRIRNKGIRLVTEFSGLEAPSCARQGLIGDFIHVSASDSSTVSREFISKNYSCQSISDSFHSKNIEQMYDADFFIAGPPCQPWSSAGERLGNNDPRARLYHETIERIIITQPKMFLLENSSHLATDEKGKTKREIISKLRMGGYQVHAQNMNTAHHGLPQFRNRLWIIGFRDDLTLTHPWAWPDEIEPCPIQFLLPDENQDHGKSTTRPNPKKARNISDIAHARAKELNFTGDWTIAEHLSRNFLKKNPHPGASPLRSLTQNKPAHGSDRVAVACRSTNAPAFKDSVITSFNGQLNLHPDMPYLGTP